MNNIAAAETEIAANPNTTVKIPAIPAGELAKPVLDKHGLQTVGVRLIKAKEANTNALTYMLVFPEYAYSIDKWHTF